MFLSVSEFIGALKSKKYYEEKYDELNELIKENIDARKRALENINYEQYYHISTALNYETVIDSNGEKVTVLKSRGATTNKTEIDIIAEFDEKREHTKKYYEEKLSKLRKEQIDFYNKALEVDEVLAELPMQTKDASIKIFVDGMSYKEVADSMHLSSSTLYRNIRREIENAIARK